MRINFKKIEIFNFKSFYNESFEFDKFNGLNLICGKNNDNIGQKNGCGKSNLAQALVFSLFGQTNDNIKNSNIANKFTNEKEVRVITYFDIENNKYKIISGLNKHGSAYCELYDITKYEVNLTKSTILETRNFLENEILHCDISIFLRTVLLSSDQNYNFFRLRKNDKKEFIEKLFDIGIFADMYSLIHKDVLQYDKNIFNIQNKILMLNKNNDNYQLCINKFEQDKKTKFDKLMYDLNSLKNEQDELKSINIRINTQDVKKYTDAIDKLTQIINKISNDIQKTDLTIKKIDIQLHKNINLKDSKQKIIDKHSELMNKLCLECKKTFSDYYNLQQYTNEINDINKNIEQITSNKDKYIKKYNELKNKYKTFKDKLNSINIKINELTSQSNLTINKIQILNVKISNIENDISQLEKQINPYSELKDQTEIQIQSEKSQLESITSKYKYLKFAENIVSQDTLRKFIIADMIGLLNNKIKTYLIKFGAKFNVIFDSDMNYILNMNGKEYEYDNFSSGERARLMIAVCFAFRDFMNIRNNFSSNILFLDEFIDGAIDSMAIESILDILKDFSEIYKQNIFIVSHRKSEMDNTIFDNIIQVVKTDNISTISYL